MMPGTLVPGECHEALKPYKIPKPDPVTKQKSEKQIKSELHFLKETRELLLKADFMHSDYLQTSNTKGAFFFFGREFRYKGRTLDHMTEIEIVPQNIVSIRKYNYGQFVTQTISNLTQAIERGEELNAE